MIILIEIIKKVPPIIPATTNRALVLSSEAKVSPSLDELMVGLDGVVLVFPLS